MVEIYILLPLFNALSSFAFDEQIKDSIINSKYLITTDERSTVIGQGF